MSNVSDPASNGFAIIPDDANDFATGPVRGIWVGGAGALTVVLWGDGTTTGRTTVTLSAVPAGTLVPVRAIRVLTSSVASLLVGLR